MPKCDEGDYYDFIIKQCFPCDNLCRRWPATIEHCQNDCPDFFESIRHRIPPEYLTTSTRLPTTTTIITSPTSTTTTTPVPTTPTTELQEHTTQSATSSSTWMASSTETPDVDTQDLGISLAETMYLYWPVLLAILILLALIGIVFKMRPIVINYFNINICQKTEMITAGANSDHTVDVEMLPTSDPEHKIAMPDAKDVPFLPLQIKS